MGRLYRRQGIYYGDYTTPEGQRVQRSLRTKDKAVARERLRQAELAATPASRGRKQRLSAAIDHVIGLMHDRAEGTRSMYRDKGRRIFLTLGDPYVHEVTRDMLSEYIKRRLSSDAKHGTAAAHTVQKELIVIRRALREAHDRGVLPVMPPMPRFSAKYKPRETWLTPQQYSELSKEIEPERRRWTALAALAGCNSSEVERVAWETTDLVSGRLRIPGTKRESRDRWVPIAPALRALLEVVPITSRRGPVVEPWINVRRGLINAVDRANRRLVVEALLAAGKASSTDLISSSPPHWKSYADLLQLARERGVEVPALLPRISPNDLRRTFASWLVQHGVPLLTVATLMGHTSTRMVERVYGKLSKQNFEDAIAALPLLQLPEPPEPPTEKA